MLGGGQAVIARVAQGLLALGSSTLSTATANDPRLLSLPRIFGAARAGERLVLGRGAVLTPLARDRARASGVQIERER